jgi:PKD repeat protein
LLPSRGDLRIQVVDGDSQSGPVGGTLSSPVIVQVTDADSQPVNGVAVEFALTSAATGADIAPPTAITDREGRAEAHVLLGDEAGLLAGEARLMVDGAVFARASFSALAKSDPPGNQPPTAAFDSHCQDLTCRFDDASTDGDGNVTGWAWAFGDGNTSTERQPNHTYGTVGTYTVTLRVTDDGGSSNESSSQVTVTTAGTPPSNRAPQAEFGLNCGDLTCAFTDRSSDDDGTVVSRHWDFGDGESSSDRNPSHTYRAAGDYKVQLTVRDDGGADASKVHTAKARAASPPPGGNKPPQADFEVKCKKRKCDFTDKSRDDDGRIVAWRWSFGDGATSRQRNRSHTYGTSGKYTVTLTVTDNGGATDTRQWDVDVKR